MKITELGLKIAGGIVAGLFMAGMLYADLRNTQETTDLRLANVESEFKQHDTELGKIREDVAAIREGVRILLRRREP